MAEQEFQVTFCAGCTKGCPGSGASAVTGGAAGGRGPWSRASPRCPTEIIIPALLNSCVSFGATRVWPTPDQAAVGCFCSAAGWKGGMKSSRGGCGPAGHCISERALQGSCLFPVAAVPPPSAVLQDTSAGCRLPQSHCSFLCLCSHLSPFLGWKHLVMEEAQL